MIADNNHRQDLLSQIDISRQRILDCTFACENTDMAHEVLLTDKINYSIILIQFLNRGMIANSDEASRSLTLIFWMTIARIMYFNILNRM